MTSNPLTYRKLRMGMIGGGRGAFIGAVHRIAAAIDGQIELVCGAFSSDAGRSLESGTDLFLPPDRCYPSFEVMIEAEATLPEGERMDFVAIVTPNHVHYEPARLALETGFHVVCEKPATFDLAEAEKLRDLVEKTGLRFCLTHNYTGYPMVREARDLVGAGHLGKIRKVVAEYPQGWLATNVEGDGQKQASWRTDPTKSGASGCVGDIGTHAENLAEFITGLRISELAADLTSFVDGRQLDDDANILLRFENGAKGVLHASQISVGEENSLNIRIYGEKAGLEWHQLEPNTLLVKYPDRPTEIRRTGGASNGDAATAATRIPAGHPEGYLEGFANLYRDFATSLREPSSNPDYPTIDDGVRGMAFIETAVKSSQANAAWTPLSTRPSTPKS
ncbi:MAG: Gfo/Idh/MocA family oxidoreductase [Chthoniobacterales bacterium]